MIRPGPVDRASLDEELRKQGIAPISGESAASASQTITNICKAKLAHEKAVWVKTVNSKKEDFSLTIDGICQVSV